jgi:hypothetical protein
MIATTLFLAAIRMRLRGTMAEQVPRLRQTEFDQKENADYAFGSG